MNCDPQSIVALAHEVLTLRRRLAETRRLINYPCNRCERRDNCEGAWDKRTIGREPGGDCLEGR